MTLRECSTLLPTLLAVTVLFATAILKVTTLNSQGSSIPIQWKISKTSFLVQLQSLTMKLFLVSIQPIIGLSNPLDLISVSLWMRWSCSCIMRFSAVVLADMQRHISLPAIRGLHQLLRHCCCVTLVDSEFVIIPGLPLVWKSENGTMEDKVRRASFEGWSKGVMRGFPFFERLCPEKNKFELGAGMLRSKIHQVTAYERAKSWVCTPATIKVLTFKHYNLQVVRGWLKEPMLEWLLLI